NTGLKSGHGQLASRITDQLVTVGGGPALQVQLDPMWLGGPAGRYPVLVDPGVTDVNADAGTFVMSPFNANNSGAPELKVGTYDGGGHVTNTYLAYGSVASRLNN